jgi:3-oxoacyl-(acyl-carrier-protein) synthase
MANACCSQISLRYRLTGPNYAVVSACSSSTTAIGLAFRMVRDGYADQALCGGTEAPVDPAVFAAWDNLGVLSRNPDPLRACRPFDAARDGCVLGEGAGALFVETLDSAETRGAQVRAEIRGFGESSDADHITRPNAEGQACAMVRAMESAGLRPDGIGLINAHGTATAANDACESRAIHLAFGEHAGRIIVGASKSFFGHLLGASGVVETIASVLTLERRRMPPNLNLDRADPECPLRLAGPEPAPHDGTALMKNSFGFGGNNAVLVLTRGT